MSCSRRWAGRRIPICRVIEEPRSVDKVVDKVVDRVLFAGELDDASLGAQAAIAAQLALRGLSSVFALPRAAGAHDDVTGVLRTGEPPFGMLQAPMHFAMPPRVPEPRNYVDLLLNRGFGDPHLLFSLASAWRGVLRVAEPAVMVVSDRPDALLAARLAGLPVVQLSRGFGIPPEEQPLPVLRPWVEQAAERRSADEAKVLRNINLLLDHVQRPRLGALHELYAGGTRLIASLPELDPHGPRADCNYCGPLQGAARGRRLSWPAGARRRVLVHLREVPVTHAKAMHTMLNALARRDSATHALLPAGTRLSAESAFLASGSMNRVHRTADWSGLLASADLCVFDGDPQVATRCALAGVPMICTPVSVEGFLLAQRVTAAGIGWGVGLVAPDLRGRFKTALRQLESSGREARAVRALARRHARLNKDEAARMVIASITRAITSSADERAAWAARAKRSKPA